MFGESKKELSSLLEMVKEVALRAFRGGAAEDRLDRVVREEPLEIQVNDRSIAVLMRTPGDDHDLVCGFLLTEQVVRRWEDIRSVRYCTQVSHPEALDNVMRVLLKPEVVLDMSRLSRHFFGSSSCGVCGKATLEQLRLVADPVRDGVTITQDVLCQMMGKLESTQKAFKATGGLHGAALFSREGEHWVTREDVGRHNAVDKVIGWSWRSREGQSEDGVLVVSGRVSFEIVQKALMARISIIVAVSAPSSLAIETAAAYNITLVGFVRGESFNLYCGGHRIIERSLLC